MNPSLSTASRLTVAAVTASTLGLAGTASAVVVVSTGGGAVNSGSFVTTTNLEGSDYTSPVPTGGETQTDSVGVTGISTINDFTLFSTSTLTGDGSASAP